MHELLDKYSLLDIILSGILICSIPFWIKPYLKFLVKFTFRVLDKF